jgi:hypothetical protein
VVAPDHEFAGDEGPKLIRSKNYLARRRAELATVPSRSRPPLGDRALLSRRTSDAASASALVRG